MNVGPLKLVTLQTSHAIRKASVCYKNGENTHLPRWTHLIFRLQNVNALYPLQTTAPLKDSLRKLTSHD